MSRENDLLREVLAETLEGFAFLLAEPADTPTVPSAAYLSGTILFHDADHAEQLTIMAPEPLCREMAANILGVEIEEIPDAAMTDALKELSNVVAGSYAARRFGKSAVWDIDAPLSSQMKTEQASDYARQPDAVSLIVDDHAVVAHIKRITKSKP